MIRENSETNNESDEWERYKSYFLELKKKKRNSENPEDNILVFFEFLFSFTLFLKIVIREQCQTLLLILIK